MRSWKENKIAVLIWAVVFFSLLLVFVGKPILTRATRKFLVSQISGRLKADVAFKELKISFLPPRLFIGGLEIRKSDGPLRYIGARAISIEPGVGPVFLGRIQIKKVAVENPSLRIDLTDDTPAKSAASRGKFRLPAAGDLLRLEISEIAISGADLALRLPGEDVRVNIGSGRASYQGGGGSERWSWDGSGEIWRGKKSLAIDRVSIIADRAGQNVTLKQFEVSGLGTVVSLKGAAYPEADLFLQVRGELAPIERALSKLGVISQPFGLAGTVGAEGRGKGAWDSLKWSGEFRGQRLEFRKRKIPRLTFSFRVKRRTVEAASGEVDFGGPVLRFNIGSLKAGTPGNFDLVAEEIPYPDLQRVIDPLPQPKLNGPVTVRVSGKAGFGPWYLSGIYAVSSPKLSLDLSPSLRPYLPLEFRNVKVAGNLGWTKERNFFLDDGTVKADGLRGTHRFQFLKSGRVTGDWSADVERISGIFPKGDVVEGRGKVGGGLEAGKGFHRAVLDLRLDTFRYADHPPARLEGALSFERGFSAVKNLKLRTEKGLVTVEGRFPIEDSEPLALNATFTDFNLAWIADVATRRFPFWKGVAGVGSGSVNLSGTPDNPSGTVALISRDAVFRGERFSNVETVIDLERGDLIFQKAKLQGTDGEASASGVIGHGRFRKFRAEVVRFPLSFLSVPSFVRSFAAQADAAVELNGPSENPEIAGNLRFFRLDEDKKSQPAGIGRVDGTASDLAWSVEMDNGAFRARGRVNALNGSAFEGEGALKKFSLSPWVPGAESSVSGAWKLSGDLRSAERWNGKASLESFSVEQGEWNLALASPVSVQVQNGRFALNEARFTGPSTKLRVSGSLNPDGGIYAAADGSAALRVLTLFPLGIGRAEGEALISARMSGTMSSPRFSGSFSAANGLLQFKGFPHPVESLTVSAVMEQNRIFFNRIDAEIGGGNVKAGGEVQLASSMDRTLLSLSGEIDHVNLRFPAWLPATLSGTLSLSGPLSNPLFRGDLIAHQARYQDEWDWQSKILTFRRKVRMERVYRANEEKIRFDLLFRSEGNTLTLKNDIATATMRGDVRLVGTNQAFGLLGRVEIVQGQVVFLDNIFDLAAGVVSFDRPDSFHMSFDLVGKTRVQTTDILLDLRTEKDDIVAVLSSQPPKDETNIIAMLTLGVDTGELTAAGTTSQSTTSSVLPGVLSGPVQSRVESGLRKARLVDTFQFVPYFSDTTKTNGLKMIVGKEVMPKVRLLYSTDLFEAGAENTMKLEQRFNDNVSLQGSVRDNRADAAQEYDLGLDFEFKFEF